MRVAGGRDVNPRRRSRRAGSGSIGRCPFSIPARCTENLSRKIFGVFLLVGEKCGIRPSLRPPLSPEGSKKPGETSSTGSEFVRPAAELTRLFALGLASDPHPASCARPSDCRRDATRTRSYCRATRWRIVGPETRAALVGRRSCARGPQGIRSDRRATDGGKRRPEEQTDGTRLAGGGVRRARGRPTARGGGESTAEGGNGPRNSRLVAQ